MIKKSDHDYALIWAKKIKAINELGGKCNKCGEIDLFVLTFHHCDSKEKDFNINNIRQIKYETMMHEINKCELLCANCHNEEHFSGDVTNTFRRDIKKHLLKYKNTNRCSICGYDKNNSSLSFHHREMEDKEFDIFLESWKYKGDCNVEILISKLKDELDKCDVLCINCHRKKHIRIEKFNEIKELIYKKVEKHTSRPDSYVDKIKEMLSFGKRQCEIVKELGCAKSTVCEVIKRYNLR